ncbi:hypothetical protein EDD85DRAFT_164949 [Armillaria nabsnona]|nr:hypothetical protein EDD85DRAFT_164949 [Armillaria nabsnona]
MIVAHVEHVLACLWRGTLSLSSSFAFHLCRPRYTHDKDSKRVEMRKDGTPALLTTLALYFEFLNDTSHVNSSAKCLFFGTFARRLEHEAEAIKRGW